MLFLNSCTKRGLWYSCRVLQVLEFQCLVEGEQVRVAGYSPERHVVLWGEKEIAVNLCQKEREREEETETLQTIKTPTDGWQIEGKKQYVLLSCWSKRGLLKLYWNDERCLEFSPHALSNTLLQNLLVVVLGSDLETVKAHRISCHILPIIRIEIDMFQRRITGIKIRQNFGFISNVHLNQVR